MANRSEYTERLVTHQLRRLSGQERLDFATSVLAEGAFDAELCNLLAAELRNEETAVLNKWLGSLPDTAAPAYLKVQLASSDAAACTL
jgi:hypothetical protein